MSYGDVDRVPHFEEPMRDEVVAAWRRQGLPPGVDPVQIFPTDHHEWIEPDLEPLPETPCWPGSSSELQRFRKHLNPDDPARLPRDLRSFIRRLRSRDHTVILRVHRGLFLSMGVHGWQRFEEVMHLLCDDPHLAFAVMRIQGEFAAAVAEKVLRDVDVDAVVFSEPISDTHGPLISPRMYEDLVLRSYDPLFEVLRRFAVETIIFMTYANSRLLLPGVLKRGFNCLWAYEVNTPAMDYRALRREFGRNLHLLGGIDLDALRAGKDAVRKEIMDKVPELLAQGGYIPMADGRVREDVPYESYIYYRRLLEDVTCRPQPGTECHRTAGR